jgi:hypothetical protein
MSEPARKDLRLYRGDTFTLPVRVWEDAVGGTPADLTGVTARAEIRDVPSGQLLATMFATVTLPNEIQLELPASSWDGFPARSSAVWDLELTYPGDVVRTMLAGSVAVLGDVTSSGDMLAGTVAVLGDVTSST